MAQNSASVKRLDLMVNSARPLDFLLLSSNSSIDPSLVPLDGHLTPISYDLLNQSH
jgi:hypothetical protein